MMKKNYTSNLGGFYHYLAFLLLLVLRPALAQDAVLIKDINTTLSNLTSYPENFVDVNGVLYFMADDGTNGYELWKSDGTAAGTMLVKDINPGTNSSNPSYLTAVNGTLFFAADDGINGAELWKSDGTLAGTVMVSDVNPGTGPGPAERTVTVCSA